MTPLELRILLHYHYSPIDFDAVENGMTVEFIDGVLRELHARGLLEDGSHDVKYQLTFLGRAYVERILALRPEDTFAVPSMSAAPIARRCMPWSHEWSKWADGGKVDMRDSYDDVPTDEGVRQYRRCEYCGRLELRSVWYSAR